MNYNDLQQYIKEYDESFKITRIDKDTPFDNHIFADYLNDNIDKFKFDGWYEKGLTRESDKFSVKKSLDKSRLFT